MEMFKKLVSKFNIKSKKAANQGMINPMNTAIHSKMNS